MTQTADAATELAREHDELDRLATRIATHGPGAERDALVNELCARFIIHIQAEERYLYPALRRLLSDGSTVAAAQARRDRAVARTIECVEKSGKLSADESDVLVAHLVVGVQDHVERHDTVLLPTLTDAGATEEVDQLGEQLHEGIVAARQEAERAGVRASAQAEHEQAAQDGQAPPPVSSTSSATADGQPGGHGFKAFVQRIAHGGSGGHPGG